MGGSWVFPGSEREGTPGGGGVGWLGGGAFLFALSLCNEIFRFIEYITHAETGS